MVGFVYFISNFIREKLKSVKQFRPGHGLTKCTKGVSVWSPNGTIIQLGLACKIRGGNPLKFTIIADHEPVKCTLVKAREND